MGVLWLSPSYCVRALSPLCLTVFTMYMDFIFSVWPSTLYSATMTVPVLVVQSA